MTRYPAAPRLDVVDELHGHRIADPYRWLEAPDDPRTVAWLAGQHALFERRRHRWPWLPAAQRRLAVLAASGHESLPRPRGDRLFLARRSGGHDLPVLRVREADGAERTLLDPMAVDPSGTTTLEAWFPSVEGELVAYQLAGGGTEEALLRVLHVATGEIVDGPIDRVRRSAVAWLPGGAGFYYVRRLHPDLVPPAERYYHRRVYLHRLGTSPDEDVLIFGEGRNKVDYYAVGLSADGRWLTVSATTGTGPSTGVWLADLAETGPQRPEFRAVQDGVDARTVVHVRAGSEPNDPIYLITDRDAPMGKVAVTTPKDPDTWTDLVPEDPGAVLTDIAVLDGPELARPLLLVTRARHAVSEITVHHLADGTPLGRVELPGSGYVRHMVDRPDGGHEAWFTYTDFTTPIGIYRYDGHAGRTDRWSELPPLDLPPIDTTQVTYRSADGTPVRMFLVHRSDLPPGPRPTVLNGYGGFGVSMPPDYTPLLAAWVQAGGVYAVASLRGGREEGSGWHRAGMLAGKQNTFDDLHAAADWLVDNRWTTPGKLGLYGASNGGLLVGAALVQRPEKYAAVACSAPLLDMLRYERFSLGSSWACEYGTAADPEQFGWLLSYSPYHRVRDGVAYPAVLFTVFDGDTRVDPLHARKMCAALQHASTGGAPILFRSEGQVGHSVRALSRGVGLLADTFAFLAAELGLPVPDGGATAGCFC